MHPPVPQALEALLSGLGTQFGILHSADADFANGYSDAWKFQTRPRTSSFELQYSYGSTEGPLRFPLPF